MRDRQRTTRVNSKDTLGACLPHLHIFDRCKDKRRSNHGIVLYSLYQYSISAPPLKAKLQTILDPFQRLPVMILSICCSKPSPRCIIQVAA